MSNSTNSLFPIYYFHYMAKFKTPGVYIEEKPVVPVSISAAESGIPVFIGYTQKAVNGNLSLSKQAFRIHSLWEYEAHFGHINTGQVSPKIQPPFKNTSVKKKFPVDNSSYRIPVFKMDACIRLYFENGGRSCYVFSCAEADTQNIPVKTDFEQALLALHAEPAGDILLMPDALSLIASEYYELINLALLYAATTRSRFVIADIHEHAFNNGKILDDAVTEFRSNVKPINGAFGVVYYPWLKTSIADTAGIGTLVLPPSPTIAAIYCRTETDRGIWKAPANVSLNGIIETIFSIDNNQQDGLNVDAIAGLSINVIRPFIGKGMLVWGARTLAGNDNEWRYVPVKRLFIWVEKSVQNGLHWAVFEPNDQQTWTQIKNAVENFLNNLWRQGAFAGAKPEQAFYVRTGFNETMTQNDIDNGRIVVEIGMAPLRPAEFIVIKITITTQSA